MARDFNGSDGYLGARLKSTQTSFTTISVAYWARTDGNGQYRGPFIIGLTDGNGTHLEFDDSWGLVWVADWTVDGKWSISKPSNSVWHHIAVTYSFADVNQDPVMYLNGVSQSITERVAPVGSAVINHTLFELGTRHGAGDAFAPFFDGHMAEFGVWNRILKPSEVAGLAKGLAPNFYLNGLEIYNPIKGRSNPEPELMGDAIGTLSGTANYVTHPRIIYPRNSR